MTKTRRQMAYHEAGHAVVGALLGAHISQVWLADPADGDGLTECSSMPTEPESRIAILWAGIVAAARQTGRTVHAGAEDREALIAAAMNLPDVNHKQNAIRRALGMRWEAERLVDGYWDVIATVAKELEAAGSLDGARVHAIVNTLAPEEELV